MNFLVEVFYQHRHLIYIAIALTLDWGDGSIIKRAMMDEGENRRPDREALEKINQVLNFLIYSGASDL